MRVRFFQCFNSLYAKSHSFSDPVMQHLVNVHCKPYLLYGADVINWTRSELASIKSCKPLWVLCDRLRPPSG